VFSILLILGLLFSEKKGLKIPIEYNLYFWIYFFASIAFIYFFGIFSQTQFIYFQF
jgi:hypothetical protein